MVREGSPGGRSETTGVGFVKEVGFKPGVKERRSDGVSPCPTRNEEPEKRRQHSLSLGGKQAEPETTE